MTGYFRADRRKLTPDERYLYRLMYCSLCQSLLARYGYRAAFLLQVDILWLMLCLDHITGFFTRFREHQKVQRRCPANPLRKVIVLDPAISGFKRAADASVLAVRLMVLDAVLDRQGTLMKKLAGYLDPMFRKNRDYLGIELEDGQIACRLRQTDRPQPDPVRRMEPVVDWLAGLLNDVLPAEGIPGLEPIIRDTLRIMFLIDAVEDYFGDRRKRRPNILEGLDTREAELPLWAENHLITAGRRIRERLGSGPHDNLLTHIMSRVLGVVFNRAVARFRKGCVACV